MPHDDFEQETQPGLAKALPPGEEILWQGAPRTWALARASMGVRWVIGYFVLLAVWRGLALGSADGAAAGASAVLFYAVMGIAAVGIILGIAWVLARTTVYTLTSARVVMRIGAALTISLNLPLKDVAAANLSLERDGTGDIHLSLKGNTKIAYLVLWPHVRPWAMRKPEPTLRAIPDAARVADRLGQAAAARIGAIRAEIPETAATAPAAPPVAVPAE